MNIIGITGGSGSGKTTFAKKLLDRTNDNISIIHMDSYYLSPLPTHLVDEKGKANFDHPEAFDWELLTDHLIKLKSGQAIDSPVYDFITSSRTERTNPIEATDVVLLEGLFTIFNEEIRNILDIKVFLHVESDIRFTRRLNRDVKERGRSLESITNQYYKTVRPMYLKYLEPQKQYADFIVGEETDVAADILCAKIKEMQGIYNDEQNNQFL
ncbi:MAG: uridine kinase [Oligoflexia bacterium]|nr:uridine kinase [Oligoflexia bacterium]